MESTVTQSKPIKAMDTELSIGAGTTNPPSYGHESRQILKNLIVLGFSAMLLFSAFLATRHLQSTLNQSHGTYALGTVYMSTLIASLFLPPIVLYKLDAKNVIVLAMCGYVLYIAVQLYPVPAALLPASGLLGICTANLWAAVSAYVTAIANEYAYLKKYSSSAATVQKFFGAFFLFFQTAEIWGNLISSAVLGSSWGTEHEVKEHNQTVSDLGVRQCGPDFCAADSGSNGGVHNADNPNDNRSSQIYTLFGIYTGCCVLATLIILLFLDPTRRYPRESRQDLEKSPKSPAALDLLISTIVHLRKPSQLLLIPITVWTGMQEAFIGSEFTAAFISCSMGLEYIGLVMLCIGPAAATSSVIVGWLTARLGRPFMFCAAATLNLACLPVMAFWIPSQHESGSILYFCALTTVWGIADGVWSPQIKALYADVFPNHAEPAFANAGVWISIGFILVYLGNGMVCMWSKIWICVGMIGVGIVCYLCMEVMEGRKRRRK